MEIGQFITLKIFSVLLASISIYSSSTFARSQTNLPTRMISSEGGKQVLIPDWNRISFNKGLPENKLSQDNNDNHYGWE